MVDAEKKVVCCMCGDVGFANKLFRCAKCRHRIQHSYCSNYYSANAEPIEVCDWCQCEERKCTYTTGRSSKKSSLIVHASLGDHQMIKPNNNREENTTTSTTLKSGNNSKRPSGVPSSRTVTRRYKLLKDVMC